MTQPQTNRIPAPVDPAKLRASNALVGLWVVSVVCIAAGCILTANAGDGVFPAIGGPLMLSAGGFGIPLALAATAIVRALGR